MCIIGVVIEIFITNSIIGKNRTHVNYFRLFYDYVVVFISKLNEFKEKLLNYPGIPYLVKIHKKFNDDNGGQHVGAITYYMFLSILPLMIASLTIFDMVFARNENLRNRLINSTIATIPVIGPTLESDLTFVKDRGLTLIVTLLILLWAARSGALALQNALWKILRHDKLEQSFLSQQLRAYASMIAISIGLVVPTIATSLTSDHWIYSLVLFVLSLFWNSLLVYLIIHILVSREAAKGIGVIIGGISIALVQFLSVNIVQRSLDNTRPLYGTLAIVLVLMAWIALQIRVLLYAAEINSFAKD